MRAIVAHLPMRPMLQHCRAELGAINRANSLACALYCYGLHRLQQLGLFVLELCW
jgi:hypothetical protein